MSRRVLIVVPVVALVVIIAVAVLVISLVAAQDTQARPELPSSLQHLRRESTLPIELPTYVPDCLIYADDAGSVVKEPDARGGQAVRIRYTARNSSDCIGFGSASLELTEANALYSLSGRVTTVSFDRLEFARLEAGSRITFQWHSEGQMCRLSGTVGGTVTEEMLLRMAASVIQTQ